MTAKFEKQKSLSHTVYSSVRDTGASERDLALMRKLFVKGMRKEELDIEIEDDDSFIIFESLDDARDYLKVL